MTTPFDVIPRLGQWGQQYPWHMLSGAGTAIGLAALARGVRRWRQGAETTHGSARWATVREVRKAGLYGRGGGVCGRLAGRLLLDDSERHVLLCGPTGCHAPGTEVLVAGGQVRSIEDIRNGDYVMGPDSTPRRVLETHTGEAEMVKILPKKGEPFTVTLDHILSLQRTNPGKESWRRQGEIVDLSVRDWLRR